MKHARNVLLAILVAMIGFGAAACTARSDGDRAREVLTRYFSLLHEGQYDEPVALYGGEYDILAEWNPTVNPNDHATLLEMGCTINGLHCLPVKTIGSREDSAPDTFEFTVQFENPDGSVFVLEPLDASTGSESVFKFTVVKREDDFVVQELPVYVP